MTDELAPIIRGQVEEALAGFDAPYVTATPPTPTSGGTLTVVVAGRVFTLGVADSWHAASLVMRWEPTSEPQLRTAHLVGLGAEGQPVEVVELWRAE